MSEGPKSRGATPPPLPVDDRLERWRLVLGGGSADGLQTELNERHQAMDASLSALYDAPAGGGGRRGGLASSAPKVGRWLDEVRRLFSTDVVRMLQKDALDRLGLQRMLLEPELLESVEPDVQLAATLLSLRSMVPDRSREAVRKVVREVARKLQAQLAPPLALAVRGETLRTVAVRRPRSQEVDPHATIRANLRRYQPELGTILPVDIRGRRRARSALKDVFLLVDQSASMASSLIHACVCASVLAELPATETHLIVFDSAVVDLSEQLGTDPVDLLFGLELGGGTDIDRALAYVETRIHRPAEAIVVLISDLFEGGDPEGVVRRCHGLREAGATVVVLLALDADGTPTHDEALAAELAQLGLTVMACSPRYFPELMGRVLRGEERLTPDLRSGTPGGHGASG